MLSKVRHYISNINLKTFIMPYLSHVSSMTVRFSTTLEKFRENVDKTANQRPTYVFQGFSRAIFAWNGKSTKWEISLAIIVRKGFSAPPFKRLSLFQQVPFSISIIATGGV